MDDPIFKKKYQKYKLKVKLWEKDFKKKHGRVPSKYDIREASQEIRDSYKMYYKLKTSFLEDTLNDVLSEDGFDILEMSQAEESQLGCDLNESLSESINGGPQIPLDISSIIDQANETPTQGFSNVQELPSKLALMGNLLNNNDEYVIKNFDAEEELDINAKAWGENVSRKPKVDIKVPKKTGEAAKSASTINLNTKLFRSTSSFSKRNPRKSLSRNNSSISKSNSLISIDGSDKQEALPDLETILIQKAKEQQMATSISSNPLLAGEIKKEGIKTQVDEGWLSRNARENGLKVNSSQASGTKSNVTSKKPVHYGLSNIDVSKIKAQEEAKPLSETDLNTSLEIQKQPAQIPPLETLKENMPIVEETIACPEPISPTPSSKKDRMQSYKTDSDSVVSESEGEQDSTEYRHIAKRRRLMPTASTGNVNTTSVPQKPAEDSKTSEAAEQKTKAVINTNEYDYVDDGAENDDPDYEEEAKPKTRKRAVAKRTKAAAKKPTSPKEPAARKPRKSTAGKKGTNTNETTPKDNKPKIPKTPATARASRSKSKKAQAVASEESLDPMNDNPEEHQPLNPEDLKIALALENAELTGVPRIQQSELEQADLVANQYINTVKSSLPSTSKAKPMPVVDAKRVLAREKLEAKIAAGKLNENFVTIDLQKKKYSRGKRTINYSKYKKKLWKDKKRIAALTGPNMDMNGCDGETLKCFTCGQAGHFARDCKVKGDNLLPLTAELEEDPSPFISLEEAAAMASAKLYQAHGYNPQKLPPVPNQAIYTKLSKEDTLESEMMECEENEELNDPQKQESTSDEEPGSSGDESGDAAAVPEEDLHDFLQSDDEVDLLDIDEIAKKADEKESSPIKKYVGHKIPLDFLEKAGLNKEELDSTATRFGGVGPLYNLNEDGSVPDVTPEVMEALKQFGHTSFRKGQERAIMRILCGMSTLVTLSTGSGKSLCYQLPAYLYSKEKKSITLVVSPLVSLMEDQVTGVPHFLRAHCLHTNQTPQQKAKVIQMISDGEVDILLISPEAIVAGERSTGFGSILRQLPPIAFACIDEAHCVSQWSHNFRPSYLMVCKVLKKNLGVRTVLGLTATATLPTRLSIINHLGIPDGENGIISDVPLPDNLIISISKDEQKDNALISLLLSKRFEGCNSIIIYCTRRDECERVAGFLRTSMQDRRDRNADDSKKRKRVNWYAEPYHAGMASSRRRTIQNAFMKNELRVVVATVAFGMGINKPDIRAVIHYNMPRNFESYVQEIGRAGRDGKISHCHLFLDSHGNDQQELRRHIYANSIDRHVIRKLLSRIFVPCSCDKNLKNNLSQGLQSQKPQASSSALQNSSYFENTSNAAPARVCPGHEIGFSIEQTVELLDIPEENIATLLCYMELDNKWGINVLSSAYIKAKVISYGGAKYLKHAAKDCPPLAMAIAMEIKKNSFKEDSNIIEFSVVDVAAAIGWNSGVVKYQLKNLEWVQVNGYSKRSPISVSFFDLGLRIKAPGDFTPEEIDDALDTLYERAVKQEQTQLIQLQYVFQGLSSVAYSNYRPCAVENFSDERGEQLKAIIRDYFRNNYPKDLKLQLDTSNVDDDYIINDINGIINMYPDNNFSGRNIARLFHGISSPNYPAVMWFRCKYWRAHCKADFNRIVQLANSVIVRRRT